MYCVYVTTYSGNKFPNKYIGSTSSKRLENGYKGSVSSKQYRNLWKEELLNNPHLFSIEVISLHQTREEALKAELDFQLKNDVVSSTEWINKSLALPNGFFGMDVSGKNNPMFGKSRKGEKHNGGENISKALNSFFLSEKSVNHRNLSRSRLKSHNPMYDDNIKDKIKETWKQKQRNVSIKNGMYGKKSAIHGMKLYNNGVITKSFKEGEQPEGWVAGRHKHDS